MFGEEFFANAVLCSTRFSQDSKTKKKRDAGKEKDEQSFIRDYKEKFFKLYDYKLEDRQFIFVNNGVCVKDGDEQQEVDA